MESSRRITYYQGRYYYVLAASDHRFCWVHEPLVATGGSMFWFGDTVAYWRSIRRSVDTA